MSSSMSRLWIKRERGRAFAHVGLVSERRVSLRGPAGVAILVCGGLAGCGARSSTDPVFDEPPTSCVEGQQIACGCPGGSIGVQVCTHENKFGVCKECRSSGEANGGGKSPSVGPVASDDDDSSDAVPDEPDETGPDGNTDTSPSGYPSGTSDSPNTARVLATGGDGVLVDVFPTSSGTYVVDSTSIRWFDFDGELVQKVNLPREVTAAACDGARFVIADGAKFTVYDLDLTVVLTANLAEGCASAVVVSADRFVCGPANDWDRVFYTYDLTTGDLVASSRPYTYHGIPMRAVPGTDDFITVTTDSSPSDFHLHTVLESGEVSFLNESPYHGDFRITEVFAFDAQPVTHLVTDEGLLLLIRADGCDGEANTFDSGCFVKDGALGTLSGSQVFLGMDSTADGRLFGLVDPAPSFLSEDETTGLIYQRIDIAARSVEEQLILDLKGVGAIVAFKYDEFNERSVVGYRNEGDYYFDDDPYPGYTVVTLAFEE